MTYEKRLGILNTDHVPPVVMIDGRAWMTRDGVVAMFPDHLEDRVAMEPLPPGDYEVVHV